MNSCNAGFYLSYLNDLKDKIDENNNLEFHLKLLSSFSSKEVITSLRSIPIDENVRKLLYVYHNIITRGLPTLCSVYVERQILSYCKTQLEIKEENKSGTIRFCHDKNLNDEFINSWFESLKLSHFIFTPNFKAQNYSSN